MKNKDQFNQIPEESKNEAGDEKTSKQEPKQVEASQLANEKSAEEQTVDQAMPESIGPDEAKEEAVAEIDINEAVQTVKEQVVIEAAATEIVEEAKVEVATETPIDESAETVKEKGAIETPAKEIVEEAKVEVITETAIDESTETVKEEMVIETSATEIVEETVADRQAEDEAGEAIEEKTVEAAEETVKEKVNQATTAEVIEESVEKTVTETPTEKAVEEKVVEVAPAKIAEEASEETVAQTPATKIAKVVVTVASAASAEEKIEAVAEEHEDEAGEHEDAHEEEAETEKVGYNKMARNELIEAMEVLVQADDVNKIKAKTALIKVSYLRKSKEEKEARYQHYLEEGGDKEDYHPADDPLEEKFNHLFDIYKHKRRIFLDNLEKEKLENLDKKKAILGEFKELINSEETLKKTYDDFRTLQDSWKVIGMVPKNEVNNLWQNYHFLVEMFFDKVKINKEFKDLDLKKNLEQKIVLCEKAEELLLETSILKSFKELQLLHEKWKEIGPTPDDKREEMWDRFKSATEKINLRRREHYKKLQDEQEGNLVAKTALCDKAESLVTENVNSIREWQNMTAQFNDLFKVWKTVGPASKKQNDEIWKRFKTSLDGFFADKKEYFGKLKDQQVNNYNIKLDLCVQAEALKDSTEWRNSTRDLINLQKEWKLVGPVPRKHSDKIWKRFRSACDEFFNRKAEHFSKIKEEEGANLKKKEELIKQVEEFNFDGNKGDNLHQLKDFQRQWTEIGFVPFKEKDRLQNIFRDVINKQLDKLNISNVEMSMSNYKSRFDVIKDAPDGDRQIYRERTFIQNKIAKMQEDILLWENNLGFLANSKKASLLKAEFEEKVEAAKKVVEVLKAKVKFLSK